MVNRLKSKGSPFKAACHVGSCTFVVGAENTGAGTINVRLQLGDANYKVPGSAGHVTAYLSDNADGSTVTATAPSGGVAIGTDGLCLETITDKVFDLISESNGKVDLTLTEAGAATWYLVVCLPSGDLAISSAITFAA